MRLVGQSRRDLMPCYSEIDHSFVRFIGNVISAMDFRWETVFCEELYNLAVTTLNSLLACQQIRSTFVENIRDEILLIPFGAQIGRIVVPRRNILHSGICDSAS